MNNYQVGMNLLKERYGNGKDNIISVATISLEINPEGYPIPCVRDVDAMYEDGVFYFTTYASTNKIKQIEANPEVAMAVAFDDFCASGIGKNLGWVLNPNNKAIREKIRKVFEQWYDNANDENDSDCCIVAIYLTKGRLNINHGETVYEFDFINQTYAIK